MLQNLNGQRILEYYVKRVRFRSSMSKRRWQIWKKKNAEEIKSYFEFVRRNILCHSNINVPRNNCYQSYHDISISSWGPFCLEILKAITIIHLRSSQCYYNDELIITFLWNRKSLLRNFMLLRSSDILVSKWRNATAHDMAYWQNYLIL